MNDMTSGCYADQAYISRMLSGCCRNSGVLVLIILLKFRKSIIYTKNKNRFVSFVSCSKKKESLAPDKTNKKN